MTYKSLQTIASRLAWCWFGRFQSCPGSDDTFQKKTWFPYPPWFSAEGLDLNTVIVIVNGDPNPQPKHGTQKKIKAWYVWWHNLEGHGSLIFHQPLTTMARWVDDFPTSLNTPSWARLSFLPVLPTIKSNIAVDGSEISQTTSWNGKYPIIDRSFNASQVVQDFWTINR